MQEHNSIRREATQSVRPINLGLAHLKPTLIILDNDPRASTTSIVPSFAAWKISKNQRHGRLTGPLSGWPIGQHSLMHLLALLTSAHGNTEGRKLLCTVRAESDLGGRVDFFTCHPSSPPSPQAYSNMRGSDSDQCPPPILRTRRLQRFAGPLWAKR